MAFAELVQAEPPGDGRSAKDWAYLENPHVRVGLLRSHGGAIGYLGDAMKPPDDRHNVLNHYDHGRLVQQSYYGDEDGSRWVKKPWRYNPVQGGDYRGRAAIVREFRSDAASAYVMTTPRHWASGELLSECTMEQWVTLRGPIVELRFRFRYSGKKKHAPRHQETPAMFVSPRLKTLVSYTQAAPWTGGEVSQRVPGWPNSIQPMRENWAAYVDESGNGVGIYVPGVEQATCYRFQGGRGSDCSYLAPLRTFSLQPGLDFGYVAYLALGDVTSIRRAFRKLHENAAN